MPPLSRVIVSLSLSENNPSFQVSSSAMNPSQTKVMEDKNQSRALSSGDATLFSRALETISKDLQEVCGHAQKWAGVNQDGKIQSFPIFQAGDTVRNQLWTVVN